MARMRGDDRRPEPMFSYVSAEERIPPDHPLRAIRALVDEILRDMSRDFGRLCAIDFGSRYGWYVDVVRRKVSDNWLKYEVDPRITSAARCFITFDITRSGQPSNIRVEQTSGVPTLDISAMRALQRIDSFGPLPSDYSGSKVSVEFWFD